MKDSLPSSGRLGAACVSAAALSPTPLAFELVGGVGDPIVNALQLLPLVLLFGFPIALLHVGLLALPLYRVLRRRWRLHWWNAAAAGFAIGAVPMSMLFQALDGAWLTGLCGLVGGLVFWAVLSLGGKSPGASGRDELDEIFA